MSKRTKKTPAQADVSTHKKDTTPVEYWSKEWWRAHMDSGCTATKCKLLMPSCPANQESVGMSKEHIFLEAKHLAESHPLNGFPDIGFAMREVIHNYPNITIQDLEDLYLKLGQVLEAAEDESWDLQQQAKLESLDTARDKEFN